SANTRFMKQIATGPDGQRAARPRRDGEGAAGDRQFRGFGGGGNSPLQIKSTDIKVGDAIAAMGEVDAAQKSVGAMGILQLDPERAKQMEQMQANYGKTWL